MSSAHVVPKARLKKVALEAVRLAGRRVLGFYQRLSASQIYKKSQHEIVTQADLESNGIIQKTITRSFPHHAQLSEETKFRATASSYLWTIDPLDGTTNFIMKDPLFCVSVAVLFRGEALFSVVWAPVLKELYWAEKGRGAYLNGVRMHVSPIKKLREALILLARGHDRQSRRNVLRLSRQLGDVALNTKQLGSTSLDLAFTAAGRVSGCVVAPPKVTLWDAAPGILLIREAGGQVTDLRGHRWNVNSPGVVASNRYIHKKLLHSVAV